LKGFQKANSAAKRTTSAHLLATSINDEALFATKAELLKAIDDLKRMQRHN
jgi:hypothetical protein